MTRVPRVRRTRSNAMRPAGYALVELLSAVATVAVLLLVTSALFRLASRTTIEIGDRAEALDAVRTATALLDRELRPLAPADFAVAPPDSIALRAFRGIAIPCDATATGGMRVRYAGIRDPDAAKDSVLAVALNGEAAAGVTAVSAAAPAAGCAPAPGEKLLALSTTVPLPAAAVLLVYERGAYSLGGGALRYRRGLGGRQPLTAAVFDGAASALRRAPDDAVEVRLEVVGPATFVLPARARVPLANPDTTREP